MTVICDGSGKGYKAKVNDQLELSTTARVIGNEAYQSLKENVYFANMSDTADTVTITTTGGPMMYIKNTSSTKNVIIQKYLVGAGQDGTVLKFVKNATVGTIGNENTHIPPNLNFSSTNTADVLCYIWDEVGDGMTGISGGTTCATFILALGEIALPANDAFVLGPNDSITIYATSIGTSSEFSLNTRFYQVEPD